MKQNSNDPYAAYLHQIHSQYNTSDEVINKFVIKAINLKPVSKKRIIRGENNEVYDVTLENNENIIVRISHKYLDSLKREKWAIEQCEKIGVPVPKILLLEDSFDDEHKISINIEEKIRGDMLKDLLEISTDKEKREFVRKAGAPLAQIHTVKTDGFGDIDKNGSSPFKKMSEWIADREKGKKHMKQVAKRNGLAENTIERIFEILKLHSSLFENIESRLLHNDYSPFHIFYDKGEISGIIDFEVARGGDPVQDFARWDYYYSDTLPLEWLKEGYTNKSLFDHNFDIKLNLYKLIAGYILLYHHDDLGNSRGINIDIKNFEKSLNFFDNK